MTDCADADVRLLSLELSPGSADGESAGSSGRRAEGKSGDCGRNKGGRGESNYGVFQSGSDARRIY